MPTRVLGSKAYGLVAAICILVFYSGSSTAVPGYGLPAKSKRLWPNQTVPYVIHKDFKRKKLLNKAIGIWNKSSPVKFKPRKKEKDYVEFNQISGDTSWSLIGREGGKQKVELSKYHYIPTFLHEMGHAVGLAHEHQRTDCRQHIRVSFDNIEADNYIEKYLYWYNNLLPEDEYEGEKLTDHGTDFDFNSIMLYSSHDVSKSFKDPVLERRLPDDKFETFDGGSRLSKTDVLTIRKMYSIPEKKDESEEKAEDSDPELEEYEQRLQKLSDRIDDLLQQVEDLKEELENTEDIDTEGSPIVEDMVSVIEEIGVLDPKLMEDSYADLDDTLNRVGSQTNLIE